MRHRRPAAGRGPARRGAAATPRSTEVRELNGGELTDDVAVVLLDRGAAAEPAAGRRPVRLDAPPGSAAPRVSGRRCTGRTGRRCCCRRCGPATAAAAAARPAASGGPDVHDVDDHGDQADDRQERHGSRRAITATAMPRMISQNALVFLSAARYASSRWIAASMNANSAKRKRASEISPTYREESRDQHAVHRLSSAVRSSRTRTGPTRQRPGPACGARSVDEFATAAAGGCGSRLLGAACQCGLLVGLLGRRRVFARRVSASARRAWPRLLLGGRLVPLGLDARRRSPRPRRPPRRATVATAPLPRSASSS